MPSRAPQVAGTGAHKCVHTCPQTEAGLGHKAQGALVHNVSMSRHQTPHTDTLHHLLLSRAQWMAAQVDAAILKRGYDDVTPAMGRLFTLMTAGPMSVSEAARQLNVTRQAVHKLAAEAAALGYAQVLPDTDDARLRLLHFTARGRAMARATQREVQRIEIRLAKVLGERRLATLRDALAASWETTIQHTPRPAP